MHQHQVVVLASGLAETIDAVADRLLPVLSAGEDPLQLGDVELVGVGLQHRFPSGETYHGDAVDVGMLLKRLHRVDDDRAVVYVHKLLGNVLSHAVAGSAGDDECIVHIVVSVFFTAKITQISDICKHSGASIC